MRLSSRVLQIAPEVRGGLAILVLLSVLTTATYVAQGVLTARVLAHVLGGDDAGSLVAPFAGIAALLVGRAVVLWSRERAASTASAVVKNALRQRLYGALLRLGPGYLQGSRTGDVQATLVDSVETFDGYVGRFLPQAIAAFIGVLGTAGVVLALDPVVGAVVLGCGTLIPIVPAVSRKLLRTRAQEWFASYRKLYSDALDAIQGMTTLKAFNASRRHGAELERQAWDFSRSSVRFNSLILLYVGVVGLVVALGTSLAVGLGAVHRAAGDLSTFELLVILMLTRECFRPMNELQNAYHSGAPAQFASRAIFAVLDADPPVPVPAVPREAPVPSPPPGVSFERIGFSYPGRAAAVLDDFSLQIEPARRVAVVGPSGSGKTTLVSLLLRFHDPYAGRITVAGTDIRDLEPRDLRALVAVVAQDTYLFHGTMRENLVLGCPDAGDADVEATARAARAHDFITALPSGYETVMGERGLTISGGQRQRIAIARALLKDAPILVLDEPTSSVDSANEAEIQEALDLLVEGRTTLVIAHRLSTVRSADRIVVLEAGRAVETGSHNELIEASGAYARLVAAQGSSR